MLAHERHVLFLYGLAVRRPRTRCLSRTAAAACARFLICSDSAAARAVRWFSASLCSLSLSRTLSPSCRLRTARIMLSKFIFSFVRYVFIASVKPNPTITHRHSVPHTLSPHRDALERAYHRNRLNPVIAVGYRNVLYDILLVQHVHPVRRDPCKQ